MISKKTKWKSKKYREFISGKPCIVCCSPYASDPHHEDDGIKNSGMGMKPPDTQCIPICRKCHDLRHKIGPLVFWHGIDYKKAMINFLTEYIVLNNLK